MVEKRIPLPLNQLKKKRRNPMPRGNGEFCPACGDTGEVKVIKNIAQIGPYHLGKETWEKCNFCSIENNNKPIQKINEKTLH